MEVYVHFISVYLKNYIEILHLHSIIETMFYFSDFLHFFMQFKITYNYVPSLWESFSNKLLSFSWKIQYVKKKKNYVSKYRHFSPNNAKNTWKRIHQNQDKTLSFSDPAKPKDILINNFFDWLMNCKKLTIENFHEKEEEHFVTNITIFKISVDVYD